MSEAWVGCRGGARRGGCAGGHRASLTIPQFTHPPPGFVLNYSDIPPWWIWAYWPNPFAWVTRALAINEFTSPSWSAPASPGGAPLGEAVLRFRGFPSDYWWCWAAVGFVLGSGALIFGLLVLAMTVLAGEGRRLVGDGPAAGRRRLAGEWRQAHATNHTPACLPRVCLRRSPAPAPRADPGGARGLQAQPRGAADARALRQPGWYVADVMTQPVYRQTAAGLASEAVTWQGLLIRAPPKLTRPTPTQDAAERGMAAWPSSAAEAGSTAPPSPSHLPAATGLGSGSTRAPPAPQSPTKAGGEVALAAVPASPRHDGHGSFADGAGASAVLAPAPALSAFEAQGSGFSE